MKLQALDLQASYGENTPGQASRRLIRNDGMKRLGTGLWEAGRRAVEVLESRVSSDGMEYQGLPHLAESLPSMAKCWGDFLDDEFLPTVLELQAAGLLKIQADGDDLDDFVEVWARYDFPDKVETFSQIVPNLFLASAGSSGFAEIVQPMLLPMTAIAILILLDDALIADFHDGDGLDEIISGIECLRPHLNSPKNMITLIEAVKSQARKTTARYAAAARHAENRSIKADVHKWLESNMARFKSMDAAAEAIAGDVAPIKWRTARDWVGEWKKLRSAGTP